MHQAADSIFNKAQVLEQLDLSNGSTGPKIKLRVQVVTATTKTLTAQDSGTIFTTYGATGDLAVTLPSVVEVGLWYRFVNSTAGTITVSAATADTLYVHGDASADSVSVTDIGDSIEIFSDGNKWYAIEAATTQAGATVTIAT